MFEILEALHYSVLGGKSVPVEFDCMANDLVDTYTDFDNLHVRFILGHTVGRTGQASVNKVSG